MSRSSWSWSSASRACFLLLVVGMLIIDHRLCFGESIGIQKMSRVSHFIDLRWDESGHEALRPKASRAQAHHSMRTIMDIFCE
ncbi:hypothetical protein QBC38DRAFT_470838 [Podospora fimiseda]|uniref:Secreted protein n=1 Tax=Podospora fimiseda TaxID=252190 RepID=A0AAN7BUQ4_9PEZI|nr:hypothetical protein QBC38DRAFT_470838 [Podospora fimiseda]